MSNLELAGHIIHLGFLTSGILFQVSACCTCGDIASLIPHSHTFLLCSLLLVSLISIVFMFHSMKISVNCQLGGIWNHLENKPVILLLLRIVRDCFA